jgi:hypothetical protein
MMRTQHEIQVVARTVTYNNVACILERVLVGIQMWFLNDRSTRKVQQYSMVF